MSNQHSDSLVN